MYCVGTLVYYNHPAKGDIVALVLRSESRLSEMK